MAKFGEHINVASFSLRGKISKEDVIKITEDLIKTIGMTPMPGALLCSYPFDSKGGNGFTFFQALTESFMAIDVWDDFEGAYLFIASCKFFDIEKVKNKLEGFGLKVHQAKRQELELHVE
jgi:hypothetical protein